MEDWERILAIWREKFAGLCAVASPDGGMSKRTLRILSPPTVGGMSVAPRETLEDMNIFGGVIRTITVSPVLDSYIVAILSASGRKSKAECR